VNLVVDASIACKWYFPEEHQGAALRLLSGSHVLSAPDLIIVEFANVAWKYVRRGAATVGEARNALNALLGVPLTIHAAADLMPAAFDLACETGRTAYDCLYLALAYAEGCQLVTADERLYNALQRGPYAHLLLWVEAIPA
jgi:predicted nucleic acid-binding protein